MNDSIKSARERSPSFPFIPLELALERLVQLDGYFRRHPAPTNKAGLAWGMKEGTSQSLQTLAALKSFGLIEYDGNADQRRAIITEDGRTYLRAQQDAIKQEIIKRCALRPRLIAALWPEWGADRPPDIVCIDKLNLKLKFNPKTAPEFLRVYDETIAFAGLSSSDKVPAGQRDIDEDDDQEEESVQTAATKAAEAIGKALPGQRHEFDEPSGPAPSGMRRTVFTLDEGDVEVMFPKGMSPTSVSDLEGYMKIWLGKLRRDAERGVKDDDGDTN